MKILIDLFVIFGLVGLLVLVLTGCSHPYYGKIPVKYNEQKEANCIVKMGDKIYLLNDCNDTKT